MPRKATTTATSMDEVKVEPNTAENLTNTASTSNAKTRAKRPERPMALMNKNPTSLTLPTSVLRWFKENEYVHRWVRYMLPDGTEDNRNITKMKQMGYEFVQINEFDTATRDEIAGWFIIKGVRQNARDSQNQCITTGDVVLAKIPQEWYDEYRDREMQSVREQELSDRQKITDSRRDLDRYVPVDDESVFG